MKRLILCSLALITIISSCNPGNNKFNSLTGFLHRPDTGKKAAATLSYETANFADTTIYAYLDANIDFPMAGGAVAKNIRESLYDILKQQLEKTGFEEEYKLEGTIKDSESADDILSKLCTKTFSLFSKEAENDMKERMEDIEDPEEEDIQNILTNLPTWGSEINLSLTRETDTYVVFDSNNYLFYGGAHGGLTGAGSLTYDKRTGYLFTDYIQDGKLEELQPLLIDGLKEYFSELEETPEDVKELLFIEGDLIPLPEWTPTPTENGLCFTYQQYEIAAYAFGMPSFTIAYDKIEPFLTKEAKDLLGLSK